MQHNQVVWGGLQEHQVPRTDGISPSLTAAMGMGGGQTPIFTETAERNNEMEKICEYRIRKLTPKECWRLMSFTDADFQKAQAVNSNTQLYRQAGNSICVNVLIAIFSQLNFDGRKAWNDMSEKERIDLTNASRDYS